MPCPTCDHTMQHVGITGNGGAVHWCPRCGTVSQTFGTSERHDYLPMLVERCWRFEQEVVGPVGDEQVCDSDSVRSLWRSLGVGESINPPANRPPA